MRKVFLFLSLLLSTALLISGCQTQTNTPSDEENEQVFVFSLAGDPATYHPDLKTDDFAYIRMFLAAWSSWDPTITSCRIWRKAGSFPTTTKR